MKIRNGLFILITFFVASKSLAVEEALKPEPLRDRLINIEKTFVEHKRRMDNQDKEVASLIMRIRHLEQLVYEQGPIILDKEPGSDSDVSGNKKKVKPYRFY
ncbi:hypothetical protein [Alteromonas macleodii]|uniref:hypothetical protein n=1 Tax=Alteromonas macleodii TaxID=28108 RepID=UPI0031407B26